MFNWKIECFFGDNWTKPFLFKILLTIRPYLNTFEVDITFAATVAASTFRFSKSLESRPLISEILKWRVLLTRSANFKDETKIHLKDSAK